MKVQVRHLVMLVAGILALMLVSCDDGDSATSFDAGINQADICEEIAEVMCHNMFECCTGKEREQMLGEELTRTEGECVDDMILLCEQTGAEKLHAVENERITFDLEAAKDCVEALVLPDNSKCFTVELEPAYLDLCMESSFFTGIVAEDGSCFWDWECEGSGYCQNDFTCTDLPAEDDECAILSIAPSQCAEDLYCGQDTDGNDICIAFGADGDDCSGQEPCDPDLHCAGWDAADPTTPGTCEAKLEVGETCTANNICASNECRPGFCAADPTDPCRDVDNDDCAEGFCAGTTDLCGDDFDCDQHCSTTTATICTLDSDCPTGETCEYDACEKECIGPICYSEPTEIDYCEEGLTAPCTIFDLPDNECSF